MAADRAEAARMQERQVVGAEAAHRDAADRQPVRVDPEAVAHRRDHFAHHVASPIAFGTIVPVAVVAAVGEGDHGRAPPELRQAAEHGLVFDEGPVGAAASVEEDQQWPLAPLVGELTRHDHVDAEAIADRPAVDRQVDDPGAVSVHGSEHGCGEDEVDGGDGEHGQDDEGRPPAAPDPASRGTA
ncbi:MAG: hypothetical protein U0R26_04340 [Solirubrobacterales bacterium]